jgi:hypothetical protein
MTGRIALWIPFAPTTAGSHIDASSADTYVTPTPYPTMEPVPTIIDYKKPENMYRKPKLTIPEVLAVNQSVVKKLGVLPTPDEKIFIHSEVYKGIPIKWSANKPIPADKLAWIKRAIDIAPDFFVKNYPIGAIMGVSNTDIGVPADDLINGIDVANVLAMASGTNIYVSRDLINPRKSEFYAPPDEKVAIRTIFHEWVHVVQYYEAVRTYTSGYIENETGGLRDLFAKETFVYDDWAKNVGWYFKEGWTTPSLKEDAESQKTSEYGRLMMYEDQAETFASIFICDTKEYSQARISGIEKIIGKKASDFCPYKP